ncbi:MAG TPA: HNH endonuclease [Verrucomicrobiae bacterium]|nr:HNH endonuclease [Verrucomicrobiae bacterium]
MSFSNLTKSQARLRQNGKCARCGETLVETEEAAHYLLRESSGGPDKEDNCVVLCQNCQTLAYHNANFHTSYVTPVGHFPYANLYGAHRSAPVRSARTR